MIKKIGMSCLLLSALLPHASAAEGRAVRTRRPARRPPVEMRLPEDLLPPQASVSSQGPQRDRGDRAFLAAADAAAFWTAERLSRTRGRIEAYRAGWFQGMKTALSDDSLGEWDRDRGFEDGLRDPEAERRGRRIGRDRARARAATAAEREVERRFMDLRWEPRFDGRFLDSSPPDWAFVEAVAVRPVPADLFRETPVNRVPYFRDKERLARYHQAFSGWKLDPLALCGVRSYQEIYDRHWTDSEGAFRYWKRNSGRSGILRLLPDPDARNRFRRRFAERFQVALPEVSRRFVRDGFRNGFQDGWEYGAWIHYRQSYEEGAADGFDRAVSLAAERSFAWSWDGFYAGSYQAAFDRWMNRLHVEVRKVRLEDGDRDGVFEPGETVLVYWELANYGGGSGLLDLEVRGATLSRSSSATVRIRGRGGKKAVRPIQVRIDPETPLHHRSKVVVAAGEQSASAGMVVSRPLQFGNGWAVDGRAILDGIAGVEIQVANRSRNPVAGFVQADGPVGENNGVTGRRELGRMAAGEERTVRFRWTGLDPLDLVSGELQVRLQVIGAEEGQGERVHDRVEVAFPNTAVDLTRDDLLALMVRMAENPGATGPEIRTVRKLLLERMRADWRAAARGRRNPYKNDFKNRTASTALGELIRVMEKLPDRIPSPAVFEGLGGDLTALSTDLPGAHPFLRKWFLKLAERAG